MPVLAGLQGTAFAPSQSDDAGPTCVDEATAGPAGVAPESHAT
jgi:hypothetical protein